MSETARSSSPEDAGWLKVRTFPLTMPGRVGAEIGIDWDAAPFDIEQFRKGMEVELEHDLHDPATKVASDDRVVTARSRSPT